MIKALSVNKYFNTWHLIGQRHSWQAIRKYVANPFNMDFYTVIQASGIQPFDYSNAVIATPNILFFFHVYILLPQDIYSLGGQTTCRKISRSFEPARFGVKQFQLLCNVTGTSAAPLPRCLSHFRAIRSLWHPIWRLRDFEIWRQDV